MAFFEINGLTKRFLGVTALNEISFQIEPGEIIGLIGPNGSGKTTLFNCITKGLVADCGKVIFEDEDITNLKSAQIAQKGIARTFQTIRIFSDLTVRENLMVSAQHHQRDNVISRITRSNVSNNFETEALMRANNLINFLGLTRLENEKASNLSYGQRKLLSFGTSIIFNPQLVLLDEPAAAVNPTMINRMGGYIKDLNEKGMTFIIVEHNMDFIMRLAHRIIVLNQGQVIAEGLPHEVQRNENVQEAYFGG